MENSLFPSADDELRAENEIKKLRLELEMGAHFGPMSDDIPPEVEKQWLDHIFNYEETRKKAKQCTVFELIGSPECKKSSEIPDDAIDAAYNELLEIMESRGVMFEALTTYDESSRLFYTFITEELFQFETEDYFMPGGFTVYVYEEFVPNHLYDLKRRLSDVMEYIFNEKYPGAERFDNYVLDTSDMIPTDEKNIRHESVLLTDFFNRYPTRNAILMSEPVFEFRLTEPTEAEKKAGSGSARFELTWTGTENEGKYSSHSGSGLVEFDLDWGWWAIKRVSIPGLEIQ